ncbi:MAG: zinc dependent phospholipase C family protein [Sphingomonadales bacterium]
MLRFMTMALVLYLPCYAHAWGFYGHQKINYYAVFLLPPDMLVFFKPQIEYLALHSVDPDKRRYLLEQEGPRHYIDLDRYGPAPYVSLPRDWKTAVAACSMDSLVKYGIGPWWIQVMLERLTKAFMAKDPEQILKMAAELGHYVADLHVPLHACSNHNGQLTGQHGIHGFWESRVPELLAEKEWDFIIGPARYYRDPLSLIWKRVLQSAAAADTVLRIEKTLRARFSSDQVYAYEERNGQLTRQFSSAYSVAYDQLLNGMIERRMRASVEAVASFWLTAWINAGQPPLRSMVRHPLAGNALLSMQQLEAAYKNNPIKGREHD